MTVDSPADIEGLQLAGSLVREVFERMKAAARPGVTTRELDTIGADLLRRAGARSAPQKFYDFPGATCISVNEHAAHGIPDDRRLADGDLVNIDVSAELGGYVADMGESFVVGRARRSRQRICDAVARAVREALKEVRPGRPRCRRSPTATTTASSRISAVMESDATSTRNRPTFRATTRSSAAG